MSLYERLGVAPDCSFVELRRQYHRLLLEYHPDKNDPADATARTHFDGIQSAYRILSNVELRLKYDQEQERHRLHRLAHADLDWDELNDDDEYSCRCGTILQLDKDDPTNIIECPNCSTRIELRNK
jgi:curved DNA-binding protein CbpA